MKTLSFSCELPNGVHARPASHIEALCNEFRAVIQWQNERTGISANAKSVLSLIGTDTLLGDHCQITIEGDDEEQALEKISRFINTEFAHCDSSLEVVEQQVGDFLPLPRSFTALNAQVSRGNAVSAGFGIGKLIRIGAINFDTLADLPESRDIELEQEALLQGLKQLMKAFELQLKTASHTEGEVVNAHLSIIKDAEFKSTLENNLVQGRSCADSVIATAKHFGEQLQKSASNYMRERELDIRDVCFQLLQSIYGEERFCNTLKLSEPTICIADDLTPSQFLELDKDLLKGLILTHGGSTSHTVILARSFAIPTLVGIDERSLTTILDNEVLVDGTLGLVATELDEPLRRYYEQEQRVVDIIEKTPESVSRSKRASSGW